MILRSFTQHLREQNWFAVGLDVCVVITGIFIGLQVTAWNEERQLKALERQYILRLEASNVANIETLENALEVHLFLEASQRKVLSLLSKPRLSSQESTQLASNIGAISVWRAIDLDTGLIDSLIASGKIEIIKNHELQAALMRESTSHRTLNSQLDNFRSWYTALQPNFLKIAAVSFDPEVLQNVDAASVSGSRAVLAGARLMGDEQELLASMELKSMLSVMLATRSNFTTMLTAHIERALDTQALLAAELAGR